MRFHIQELFIELQSDDEARAIFLLTHMVRLLDQVQWAVSESLYKTHQLFIEIWSCYCYCSFPGRVMLSKVSTKYCMCVINAVVVLTLQWMQLSLKHWRFQTRNCLLYVPPDLCRLVILRQGIFATCVLAHRSIRCADFTPIHTDQVRWLPFTSRSFIMLLGLVLGRSCAIAPQFPPTFRSGCLVFYMMCSCFSAGFV